MAKKLEVKGLSALELHRSARIEGLGMSISPMKSGKIRSYYDGEIADGCSKLRFCGFDSSTHRKLEESYEKGEAVLLKDCGVKIAR